MERQQRVKEKKDHDPVKIVKFVSLPGRPVIARSNATKQSSAAPTDRTAQTPWMASLRSP